MNNLKTITKYTFKEQFFPYYPNKKAMNMPNSYVLRILYFIGLYGLLAYVVYSFMKAIATVYLSLPNGESMYFAFFGILLTISIIVFYIPRILSDFFSDTKINIYKTLPITESELFMGKLLGSVLSFVDFLLFFIIGIYIYFSIKGFDISVLFFGILNFFTIILIPYSLLTGLILIIMRFTSVGNHRKALKNIGYIILFAIIGAYYYFAFNFKGDSGKESQIFTTATSALANFSNAFFNAKFYGLSLSGSLGQKITYSLILWAITIAITFIMYKLSGKFYYKSLGEKDEETNVKKKENINKSASFVPKSQVYAIAKRDIKNLTSNIVFFSQAVMMVIIFVVMGLSVGKSLGSEISKNDLYSLTGRFWSFFAGIIFGILMWMNGGFANSSLSREHKSFYLFQSLPIDPKKHFLARLCSSFILCLPFNLVMSILITIFVGLGIVNGILLFLGLSVASLLAAIVGLYTGSKKIIINWTKPEELSKGGLRNFVYYILSLIYVGLLIGLYILLMNISSMGEILGPILIISLIIVTSLVFYKLALNSYKNGFYDL